MPKGRTPGKMVPNAQTITRQAQKVAGGPAHPAGGRPKSNIGMYLLRPTDTTDTGSEFVNTKPMSVQSAERDYLKKGELPPALQPKYLRKPAVMDTARRNAISKGFVKPRARM